MKIKLLPTNAREIALKILDGELPPETDSMSVVDYLCEIAIDRGLELSFYRGEAGHEVTFSIDQAQAAIARKIEMRPMPTDV